MYVLSHFLVNASELCRVAETGAALQRNGLIWSSPPRSYLRAPPPTARVETHLLTRVLSPPNPQLPPNKTKDGRVQQQSNRKSSTKVVPMDTIVGSPANDDLRDLPDETKDTGSPGGLQRGKSTAEEKASVRSAIPSVSARETDHSERATSRLGFRSALCS